MPLQSLSETPLCKFEKVATETYQCTDCRATIERVADHELPIRRRCDAPGQRHDAAARAERLSRAALKWMQAGRPVRIETEVARIYSEACKPCQHFHRNGCGICDCPTRSHGPALRNKIRMQTEHCPLSDPRW